MPSSLIRRSSKVTAKDAVSTTEPEAKPETPLNTNYDDDKKKAAIVSVFKSSKQEKTEEQSNTTDIEDEKPQERDKKGWGKLKDKNISNMKDHDFEWSEKFKKRQQQSVFDRLMGGGKKK